MIEIYNFGKEWQVHTSLDGAYAGSFNEIMKFCIKEIRIPAYELEAAISTMEICNHNAARFETDRTLKYTFDKSDRKMEN